MVGSDLEPTLGTATIWQLLDELKRRIEVLEVNVTFKDETRRQNTLTYKDQTQTYTFKE